ncbi:hypothetical protein SLA2020_188730 [Shorea laevis]
MGDRVEARGTAILCLKSPLTAEPTGGDFAVVLLCYYNNTEELLYYKNGGDSSWTQFYEMGVPNFIECCDIMCCGNNLYVLGPGWFYLGFRG